MELALSSVCGMGKFPRHSGAPTAPTASARLPRLSLKTRRAQHCSASSLWSSTGRFSTATTRCCTCVRQARSRSKSPRAARSYQWSRHRVGISSCRSRTIVLPFHRCPTPTGHSDIFWWTPAARSDPSTTSARLRRGQLAAVVLATAPPRLQLKMQWRVTVQSLWSASLLWRQPVTLAVWFHPRGLRLHRVSKCTLPLPLHCTVDQKSDFG